MSGYGGRQKVGDVLAEMARSPAGDRAFLHWQGKPISFRQVDEAADRLATGLLRLGIRRGDNIAIVMPNDPAWLYSFFAAAKIGAGLVALNVRYRAAEFEYMLNNAEVKLLICVRGFAGFDYYEFFAGFRQRVPVVRHFVFTDVGDDGALSFDSLLDAPDPERLEMAAEGVRPDDTLVIIYTSGTTGRPKGAMTTHRSILASARAQAVHIGARPEDVVIGSLPLNHVGGITCGVATMLVAGGSVALVPYFRPDLVVEAVRRHRVTIFAGVPTMYHMVFGYPGFSPADFSSVRLCIVGGSSVEPRLATQIANTFPWAQLINLYGLSESSGACIMSPLGEPVDKVATSIGVPIGDFRVKVVDNERRDVPAGETGELVIYGDCVAKGYYGLPEATRETFGADGALYTGDMGYLEPDGHVVLRGRKKEMYVQGGFNVYPVEIENLLMKHPKVAVVAGIGVPDPVFGEVGRFYVVPRPGAQLTAEELLAYCRENLADYKVPRQFIFVDELPLTPAGKIHKALLRQWYEEGRL